MSKITLNDLASLTNEATALSTINANFQAIQDAIDLLLSRDGTSPNTMEANLDMNSYRIQNLPEAEDPTEPVRLGDIDTLLALETAPSRWYNGAGAPDDTLYEVGDYWLDTATSDVYEKTAEDTWTLVVNLKGNTGDTGPAGPGSGDMSKSTYDANNDGVVDSAAAAPWSGITGKPTTLSGYGITDAQPLSTKLSNLSNLTWAANTFPYFSGTNTVLAGQLTSAGLALLDDADAVAQRTTLGLGTMATRNTVTTGDITNGAVTLAKLDTTGSAGLVLASNGSGSAPSWQALAANAPALVLLSTLTPSAATTLSASSLTLTSYKKLYIVLNGVRPNTTTATALQISNNTTFTTVSGNATSSSAITGYIDIDLENGMGAYHAALTASAAPTIAGITTAIRNATTVITFRFVTTTVQFSAAVGNIKIYGVM